MSKNNYKTVSVIIPTHDRCDMLIKAINSVIAQKGVNLDIIVIDDLSSDNTSNQIKEYKTFKINYIINTINLGPGKSRQKGFLEAKGDYVVYLDDDDYYTDSYFFKKAIDILETDTSLAFVSANVNNYHVDSKRFVRTSLGLKGHVKGLDYFEGLMIKYKKPTSTFSTIFRKSILDKAEFCKMEMMNDSSIYLRALLFGDAYILEDVIGVYTIHESNISKTISLPFLYENLEEKLHILHMPPCKIDNPKDWWFQHYKLTYLYFVASSHHVEDELSILNWGIRNHNGSFGMIFYILIRYIKLPYRLLRYRYRQYL